MTQADFTTGEEAAAKKASRSFKKYTYRGVELDQLLDLNNESFIEVSAVRTWLGVAGCAGCARLG
jgi:small subunit ribosomal protein S15e